MSMRLFRSSLFTAAALALAVAPSSAQVVTNGTVVQQYTLQCTSGGFFTYTVNNWGPAPCVPPTPYDAVGRPAQGWGATAACTTGGSFDCAPGDVFDGMFPASSGVGYGDSASGAPPTFLTLTAGAPGPSPIPQVGVNGFIIRTLAGPLDVERTIQVSTVGGILLNTTLANQAATVDLTLQREGPTGTFVNLWTRRYFINTSNPTVAQNGGVQFAIEYYDRPGTGVWSYRLQGGLVATTGPSVFIGAGNSATRTTLAAKQFIQ